MPTDTTRTTTTTTTTRPRYNAPISPAPDGGTVYCGERTATGVVVTRRVSSTKTRNGIRASALPLRLDLRNHSPTGFEWSYGGSGPAQLALALLADALGVDEQALSLYQTFKWKVVACLPEVKWQLSQAEVCRIAQEIAEEKQAAATSPVGVNRPTTVPAP